MVTGSNPVSLKSLNAKTRSASNESRLIHHTSVNDGTGNSQGGRFRLKDAPNGLATMNSSQGWGKSDN